MGWTFVFLMIVLKIPIVAAIWIVWWAVKQEPDPTEGSDDGGTKYPRPRPHPPRRFPKTPRRGPHGDPIPPAPPRVRTTVARARSLEH